MTTTPAPIPANMPTLEDDSSSVVTESSESPPKLKESEALEPSSLEDEEELSVVSGGLGSTCFAIAVEIRLNSLCPQPHFAS